MPEHKPGYIVVIVFTVIFLAIALLFNSGQEILENIIPGVFLSDTGTISDEFYLDLTPPGWTFTIWAVIYLWQAAWVVYAHTLLCRKTNDWQGYLYYRPDFMPLSLYLVYWLNLGLNVSWLVAFDRKVLEAAVPILFLISITCYICMGISYHALYKTGPTLLRNGHGREIILVRVFVQNGLGVYAGWTTIASLLNLAQALAYTSVGLKQEDASSIALGLLALELVVFLTVDLAVTDKYSRYTFTPYLVVVFAVAASLSKDWQAGYRNSTMKAVDLALGCAALLIKIIFVTVKSLKQPEPILESEQEQRKSEIA